MSRAPRQTTQRARRHPTACSPRLWKPLDRPRQPLHDGVFPQLLDALRSDRPYQLARPLVHQRDAAGGSHGAASSRINATSAAIARLSGCATARPIRSASLLAHPSRDESAGKPGDGAHIRPDGDGLDREPTPRGPLGCACCRGLIRRARASASSRRPSGAGPLRGYVHGTAVVRRSASRSVSAHTAETRANRCRRKGSCRGTRTAVA
jgi:hypothetical protein